MTEPSILWQNERCAVVGKPSGMIVHRGWARDAVVAMSWLRDVLGRHVFPVHRLDRGTSGALLFALDAEAARVLQAQFESDRLVKVEKTYLALVRGPLEAALHIDHPVPKGEEGPRVEAQTSVRPLFSLGRYSWVEARPLTGRLHQIRRHLKHVSHPIIGDVRYGKGEHNRYFRERHGLCRLALHAAELSFIPPGETEVRRIVAPLPADLLGPLRDWGLPIV